MKLTKAQIKGKQEELGRAQANASLGGGAALPPGVARCYPPTCTLQPPGVFRSRPPGVLNQGAATDSAGTGLKDNSDELGLGSRPGRHDDTDRLCGGADRLSHAEGSAAGRFVNGMKP